VALGGGRLKGVADLCMAKVVRLSALAGVVAAGSKGMMMECSGDLSVREVEGFGGRDGFESESTEKRSSASQHHTAPRCNPLSDHFCILHKELAEPLPRHRKL
jgi:hypothetical protein